MMPAFQAEEIDDDVLPDVDDDNFLALGLTREQTLMAKAFRASGFVESSIPSASPKAVPAPNPSSAKAASVPVIPASCVFMNELLCSINHPELTSRWIEEDVDDSLLPDMELEVTHADRFMLMDRHK
jgi:hypothetical protein